MKEERRGNGGEERIEKDKRKGKEGILAKKREPD